MSIPNPPVTEVEKQIVAIHQRNQTRMACPCCSEMSSVYEATLLDENTYPFTTCDEPDADCPFCATPLKLSVAYPAVSCSWVVDSERDKWLSEVAPDDVSTNDEGGA